MELIKKNKSLIIAVVLFAFALWAYTAFLKPTFIATTDTTAQAVGSDVLALYSSLQSVALDQSIFSSPLYRNLVDFSTPLVNQPTGRPDPFAVIGR